MSYWKDHWFRLGNLYEIVSLIYHTKLDKITNLYELFCCICLYKQSNFCTLLLYLYSIFPLWTCTCTPYLHTCICSSKLTFVLIFSSCSLPTTWTINVYLSTSPPFLHSLFVELCISTRPIIIDNIGEEDEEAPRVALPDGGEGRLIHNMCPESWLINKIFQKWLYFGYVAPHLRSIKN